ncbi:MAG: HD domain-containing protein [Erysipelotrichaceae bacterium]|nr:HD domain-containing protein [Erysipelotrichaceae bacterium]MDY6034072.1 HD domain-containing protein [Bulleidia sp.]
MTKINELEVGKRYVLPLLIKDVKNGTTNKGAQYLSLVVQDSSGFMDAKFWDVKQEDKDAVKVGHVQEVSFEVLDYNKNLQLRINRITPIDESQLNMSEFVISSSQSEQERRDKLQAILNSIHNDVYRTLVMGMLKYVGRKFIDYPAASQIHHNYLGGLSEHSISMVEVCQMLCKHYPQLDYDLLVSGALIHDIGKTSEMSGAIATEYTLEGKLEGHISIANGWLTEVAAQEHLEDREETVLLHHMILSHHGKMEFGSPVTPRLQEAEVLYLVDNLDARMNMLKQALDTVKPGNWTTKLFALENRQFYKPKGNR